MSAWQAQKCMQHADSGESAHTTFTSERTSRGKGGQGKIVPHAVFAGDECKTALFENEADLVEKLGCHFSEEMLSAVNPALVSP